MFLHTFLRSYSTYNRKSSTVVKKTVRWIFIEIVRYDYLKFKGKFPMSMYDRMSTYNRKLRVTNPSLMFCTEKYCVTQSKSLLWLLLGGEKKAPMT